MADEEYVTLAEVRELLTAENEKRELLNSQTAAMVHAQSVAKTSVEDAKEMVAKLKELDFVDSRIAVKIADIMPNYSNEVRAIFSKERITLDEDMIDRVIGICDEYR